MNRAKRPFARLARGTSKSLRIFIIVPIWCMCRHTSLSRIGPSFADVGPNVAEIG